MDSADTIIGNNKPAASIEDVHRLLDIEGLLISVLKPEEIKAIHAFFSEACKEDQIGNNRGVLGPANSWKMGSL